jgi:hypothetical protein
LEIGRNMVGGPACCRGEASGHKGERLAAATKHGRQSLEVAGMALAARADVTLGCYMMQDKAAAEIYGLGKDTIFIDKRWLYEKRGHGDGPGVLDVHVFKRN